MLRAWLVTHLLFVLLLNLGFVAGCHEAEREALFKFKQSLTDDYNLLSSWEGNDCCHWEGVGCDNVTSYVNRLDLPNPPDLTYWDPYSSYGDPYSLYESFCYASMLIKAPKLDPSLVELRHLNYLGLSCMNFQGSQIPGFIGSFKLLRHLKLWNSNFSGVVPSQLGNLTRLHTLDLSIPFDPFFFYSRHTLSTDLHWVSKLVSLRYLNMGGILISHSMNSTHMLNMPPLLGLRLYYCELSVPWFLSLFSNSTWPSTIQLLDLSHNLLEGPLPRVFANMTSLTYLDLSSNNFNKSIPPWFRNLRRLEHLAFSGNMLEGPLPRVITNMTSLRHLDLSGNKFNGSIPLWMRNMRKLENLDLSNNSFSRVEGGTIMGILGNLCKLKTFDLSSNSIEGSIAANQNFLECVTYDLESLLLASNMIGGTLPYRLGDLKSLRVVDIGNNIINGHIPLSLGSLSHLEALNLNQNNLTGTLPDYLGDFRNLSMLNVGGNRISGQIPTSIGNLSSVHWLDLSHNSLQGVVSESHLANLSKLIVLDLSSNPLDFNLSSNWLPPFQLSELYMKSCKVQTQFPRWIGNQTQLSVLDLSDNMMFGKLDQWFPNTQLNEINISHNQFTGPVPYFSSSQLNSIDLSYNLLSGPLLHDDPSTKNDLVGIPVCQLPYLGFLDLQRNQIVGTIPDCWGYSDQLEYVNLSSNNLSGIIPMTMGLIQYLGFLKLSNNSLQGPIPPTLSTSAHLQILDLGENKLVGNIPSTWDHPLLEMLMLQGNQLVGAIPPTLCALPKLQLIDLAHNNLTGTIPRCLGRLTSMRSPPSQDDNGVYVINGPAYASSGFASPPTYIDPREDTTTVVMKGAELEYTTTLKFVVNLDLSCNALTGSIPDEITNLSSLIGLNLSHNHLTGRIPMKIGEMRSLQSLDLSNNNLSETIPSSLSDLTSLIAVNLSYNKLHGQIPTGHQLQVIKDPSTSYIGNPGLCGDPLPNKCETSPDQNQSQQEQEDQDKEDNREKPLFYFVIISGFATGFWGVVGSLLLKSRFRFALFQIVDKIADYLYVQVMIRLNRLRN